MHATTQMLHTGSVALLMVAWRQGLPMGGLGRTLGEGPRNKTELKSPRLPPVTQNLIGAQLAPSQRERPLRTVGKAPGARTSRAQPRPEEPHPGQLPNPDSNPREMLMAARKGVGSLRRRLRWAQRRTSNLDTKQARPKVTLCKGDSSLPLQCCLKSEQSNL